VPAESGNSLPAILGTLTAHRVEFIVAGGVSAALQGAPLTTFDLGVVHSRSPENLQRLPAALGELDAHYRAQPERRLAPAKSHLETGGHRLSMTRNGPLDPLGEIGNGHGYDDLLHDALDFELAPGVRIHVLGLRKLIEVKRETAGEKDLALLPVLERTLEESRRAPALLSRYSQVRVYNPTVARGRKRKSWLQAVDGAVALAGRRERGIRVQ